MEDKTFKIGHHYKDIISVSKDQDQFVSWFSHNSSGIGNSGGIRAAKYLNLDSTIPSYIVLLTRNISHRWYNPWEDIIDYSSGYIHYWGDAKFDSTKDFDEFRGNKHLKNIYHKVLENRLAEVPPILHFSKVKSGVVKFNGLCALSRLELTWFEDKGNPVKNYRCELTILDSETVDVKWLHERVDCSDSSKLNTNAPKVQKTGIVYHLRRIKLSHPRRTKVSIVGRMKVSH